MTLTDLAQKYGFKPTGILHVGACMLEEAQQYKDLGVDNVIWVEAQPDDPDRQSRAKAFGNALYEFTPLSDTQECVSLRIASNLVSSSILPFKRHSEIYPDIVVTNEIPVVTQRGDVLFSEGIPGIDTMVIDVQGAELKVLIGMGKLLDQIQRIFAEVNIKEQYAGCVLQPEIETWLASKGFVNKEIIPVHLEEWSEGLFWR